MSCVLIIDGMNFFHRCRAGLRGQNAFEFNVFRNLRAEVARHGASAVYLVLEGSPRQRLAVDPAYKANRAPELKTPEERRALDSFFVDVGVCVEFLAAAFPVRVARHPDHEADDVIAAVAQLAGDGRPVVVSSTDTDFTQLAQLRPDVTVWNPRTKSVVVPPPYDYVTWKALRGDPGDNIIGFDGVGDKTAAYLAASPTELGAFLDERGDDAWHRYATNIHQVQFHDPAEVLDGVSVRWGTWDPARVAARFAGWGFRSLLAPDAWARYAATFAAVDG